VPDVVLPGCRTEPLAGYLKALGVLRMVGEQADPEARAFWKDRTLVLSSALDHEQLISFFIDELAPTPLVAPWNGGSGFQPQDKMPRAVVQQLLATTTPRLAAYRRAALAADAVISPFVRDGKVADGLKDSIRQACRNQLPDDALDWFDAVVVLAADRSVFPPLLGTGGNDGKLEFSNNYLRHVLAVIPDLAWPDRRRAEVEGWLRGALQADDAGRLAKAAVGQFDPGAAGAANSAPTGAAASLVNPWGFVLMCQGALMFAASAARRMSTDSQGRAAVPFTVHSSSVGLGNTADRGEVWLPVWEQPATASEVSHLIGEGRAEWNGRQAKRGVDVVRALATLGVERGITEFARYAIDVRMGRQMLAVPAGHFPVRSVPDVALLRGPLDSWIDRVRRRLDNAPAAIPPAVQRVDQAMFALAAATDAQVTRLLQEVLVAIAVLEDRVATATRFRTEVGLRPVPGLPARTWLPRLDDGTAEFAVAAAAALQRGPGDLGLRALVKPLKINERGRVTGWSDGPARVTGLGRQAVTRVLAQALVLRLRSLTSADRGPDEAVGVLGAAAFGPAVPLIATEAFAAGVLDEARLERLLRGLLLLTPDSSDRLSARHLDVPPQPGWRVLAPFFARQAPSKAPLGEQRSPLRAEARWAALLAAGAIAPALEAALRRLRIAGDDPVGDASTMAAQVANPAVTGTRWAAALWPSMSWRSGERLREAVAPSKELQADGSGEQPNATEREHL